MNFRLSLTAKIAAIGTVVLATPPVSAQDIEIGRNMYERRCAVCHGPEGNGDGMVAELFERKPANLTQLSEQNNGTFPFGRVYQAIDGRREIAGHGRSQMPIWGDVFATEALPKTVHPGVSAEDIVQGRILSLVYFIQSIQD